MLTEKNAVIGITVRNKGTAGLNPEIVFPSKIHPLAIGKDAIVSKQHVSTAIRAHARFCSVLKSKSKIKN